MVRVLLRSLFALVVAAAAVVVGWRVLAPAEVLATVGSPVPVAGHSSPGVTGRAGVAPLIVDGRIRVYASTRQIRADAPVDAKTVYTAIWSLRRWPAQVSGVVAAGRTVISRWSDGAVIAVDGLTGKIAWRAGLSPSSGYSGHRTGASTVWDPRGLRLFGESLLVTAGGRLFSYEVSTGTRRWEVSADCASIFTTAGSQVVCSSGAYDVGTGAPAAGFPAGPYRAVGCGVAWSGCAGLLDGDGHGWLTTGATAIRAAALDRPGGTIVAGLVFYPDGTGLRAVDAVTGKDVRDYPVGAVVLGVSGAGMAGAGMTGAGMTGAGTAGAGTAGAGTAGAGTAGAGTAGAGTAGAGTTGAGTTGAGPTGAAPAGAGTAGATDPSAGAVAPTAGAGVVLLTADRRLLVVEPRAGVTLAEFPLAYGAEKRDWDSGLWQVTDGYVAIERLAEHGPDNPDIPGYYFSAEPVIIAAL